MKEYRKSYKGLIVWILLLMPAMGGAVLAAESFGLEALDLTVVSMIALLIMLDALFVLMWAGEHVYWINGGPSFEQARDAGSDARREYAWRYLKVMLIGSAAAFALLAALWALKANELMTVLLVAGCIVASALSTVGIKWKEPETDKRKDGEL